MMWSCAIPCGTGCTFSHQECYVVYLTLCVYDSELGMGARGMLSQWDVFMEQMEPLASRMPFMLIPGSAYLPT